MKFNVHARARVSFALTLREIDMLLEGSRSHYDWVCRCASLNREKGDSQNGLFVLWKWSYESQLDLVEADKTEHFITAENREIQTACKCLELPIVGLDYVDQITLSNKLYKFLRHMNKAEAEWTRDVEIN